MYTIDYFLVLRFVIFQVDALYIIFEEPFVPLILFEDVRWLCFSHEYLTSKRDCVNLFDHWAYKEGEHHCYQF